MTAPRSARSRRSFDGSAVAVATSVMNVATYGFTIIAARVIGPSEYGAFAACLSFLLVVQVGGIRKDIYVRAGDPEFVSSNAAGELFGSDDDGLPVQRAAERHVEQDERREDGQPDHECELVLRRRRDGLGRGGHVRQSSLTVEVMCRDGDETGRPTGVSRAGAPGGGGRPRRRRRQRGPR